MNTLKDELAVLKTEFGQKNIDSFLSAIEETQKDQTHFLLISGE
jgi:hypothetical protein